MKQHLVNITQSEMIKRAGILATLTIETHGKVSQKTVTELRKQLTEFDKIKHSDFMPVIVETRELLRRTLTLCKTKSEVSYKIAVQARNKATEAASAYVEGL